MDAVTQELHDKGLIYFDPKENEWVTAEEYLSGNIKAKIKAAEDAGLTKNVADLKKNLPLAVMPDAPPDVKAECAKALGIELSELSEPEFDKLMANTLSIRFGSSWVPAEIYQTFLRQLLNLNNINVHYSHASSTWTVVNNGASSSVENNRTYGARYDGIKLAEIALNLKDPVVYDVVDDKTVLNPTETEQCRNKTGLIKDAFMNWVWTDTGRAVELTTLYNNTFNTQKPRRYNGSHLTFPGMNPDISLREHQKNQVWRIIQEQSTGIFAAVGSGKTYTMITACMELRRLKLCFKPVIACLNSTVKQITTEAKLLYPNAKILSEPESLSKEKRRRFLSRIATGDWDIIIISHTHFFSVRIDKDAELSFLYEELNKIRTEIRLSDCRDATKTLERQKNNLEARIKKVTESERKDDGFTFEQLGVDCLMLDESQQFKNLSFITKQRNIAGLPNSHSQRAQDTCMKIHYLLNNNGRVVFSTGTPISNSMAELYTQMRYLMPDEMERMGINHFDAWCSLFGETVTAPEITPAGKYKVKNRFAKFVNLPELMNLFRKVADITTEDMIDLPKPKVNLINPVSPQSSEQASYMTSLAKRADRIYNRMVEPEIDNMLKVTSDGRKCSLDPRLVGAGPNFQGSKLDELIFNVWTIWKLSTPIQGTQIIFCDLRESIYGWIKDGLIQMGIPNHQIQIAQEVKDKKTLYAKVNRGEVRVIIGSTQTLGTGVNVQQRMIAQHDYDAPWRPSDVVQRLGRTARQGNICKQVWVFRYVTTGAKSLASFDSFAWQVLETKAKFIAQVWQSNDLPRTAEDITGQALTYAQVKALATGDPIMLEQAELQQEQSRLNLLYKAWSNEQTRFHYDKQQAPKLIKELPAKIKHLESILNNREIIILGQQYNSLNDAANVIQDLRKTNLGWGNELGSVYGLPLKCEWQEKNVFFLDNTFIKLGYTETILESLERITNRLPDTLERLKQSLDGANKTLKQNAAPFAYAEQLKAINQRLKEIHDIIFKPEEAAPGEDDTSETEELEQPEHDVITTPTYHSFDYLKDRELPEWATEMIAIIPQPKSNNIIPFPIHKEITPLEIITPTRFEAVSRDESILQGCLF
ncbi:helicase-related protein [Synechococcus sp. PCC 6312]|uniref:helicase-related protein n=1 Tax=Synechococcus sp. (strain ATCC 27167 / PCC 6312) TaxID=195253 RepID=UPI00029F4A0A|nr:helicase-related protein [Synechococcus sp. PCC 6312]AFY61892.1 helicase family protein [Synechococcus sp. PCC 6312]